MIISIVSVVLAVAGGYFATILFEHPGAGSFARRHPAVVAIVAATIVVSAASLLILASLAAGSYDAVLRRQVIAGLIALAILSFGICAPLALILRRLGYNWAWTIAALVPFGQFVGLWTLALRRWPLEKKIDESGSEAND